MASFGHSVIVSQVSAVLEAAVRAGLDRGALIAAAGLSQGTLASADARVPFSAEVAVWETIERCLPGEPIGLALADVSFDADAFGAVGFAARTSVDLGAAFGIAARYCGLMNEGTETRLAREGPVARLVDGPRSPHERWPRAKAEFVLGGYVILGRRWTESDWSPCEVRFQHVAPVRTEPYQSLFRSRVSFGQARNEILFDAALLAKPLKHADPDVAAYLCRQAEIQSLAIRPATSLLDLVRRCVERELPNGAPTVTAVSRQLEVKRRTLQRRLAALGTSFSALVDEARREVALRCALKPGATENQLAFRTGLSEDRAFRRAFRRWTGLSFAEWRAREMAPRVRSHGARGPSR